MNILLPSNCSMTYHITLCQRDNIVTEYTCQFMLHLTPWNLHEPILCNTLALCYSHGDESNVYDAFSWTEKRLG